MDLRLNRQQDRYFDAERGRVMASTHAMTQSGILCGGLFLLYTLTFDPSGVWISLGLSVGFLAAWLLLRSGHYQAGRAFAFGSAYVGITLAAVHYGPNSNTYLLLAVVVLAALACFRRTGVRVALAGLTVATTYASMDGRLNFLLADADVNAPYEATVFTLLSIVACYWITDDLLGVNRDFRLRSRRAVDAIGMRSAKLQRGLQRLGRQAEDLKAANRAFAEELVRGESVERQLNVNRELLEQFVYAASHDLKEPLRSISGFVQLIRRKTSTFQDDKLNEYFDFVLSSSTGMTQLLDGLLVYSRAGREEAPAEHVDLDRLVAIVRHDLQTQIRETAAELTITGSLSPTFCQKRAAREIIKQILDNALKFTSPGVAPVVEIGPCPLRPSDCLLIRDHGIGIDPAFREKVFLLFQRLNRVDDYGGAGIGLALARKLADANGINIEIMTPPDGPGTVFRISFPQADRS